MQRPLFAGRKTPEMPPLAERSSLVRYLQDQKLPDGAVEVARKIVAGFVPVTRFGLSRLQSRHSTYAHREVLRRAVLYAFRLEVSAIRVVRLNVPEPRLPRRLVGSLRDTAWKTRKEEIWSAVDDRTRIALMNALREDFGGARERLEQTYGARLGLHLEDTFWHSLYSYCASVATGQDDLTRDLLLLTTTQPYNPLLGWNSKEPTVFYVGCR